MSYLFKRNREFINSLFYLQPTDNERYCLVIEIENNHVKTNDIIYAQTNADKDIKRSFFLLQQTCKILIFRPNVRLDLQYRLRKSIKIVNI
jgi:hypothetical protein